MTVFTRRNVLAGAAVAAATAAHPGTATAADETKDLDAFVALSSALTGITAVMLAPAVDPVQIKREYFDVAKSSPSFDRLLQIFRDNASKPPEAIADVVLNQSGSDVRYLGRSIMLAWYLGAWYKPETLARYNSPNPPLESLTPDRVISPAAYTQGWTWRVAQAHPMGYSELRFGYWSEPPLSLVDLTGA
jgi:hypothetical protein